jgi:hypothetical protein
VLETSVRLANTGRVELSRGALAGSVFAIRAGRRAGPNRAKFTCRIWRCGGWSTATPVHFLESVVRFKLDEQVQDRIVAEARGNPLALLGLP